jgi:dTMP kinase
MKSLFITFEGIDGSGKTSQIEKLAFWMKERNVPFVLTKEPGTPHIKECLNIREILLNPNNSIVPEAELLMFLADRAQHIKGLIEPSLKDGKHVICDRFADSTRVYQCARGFSRDMVDRLIDFSTNGLEPDITFIMDIPVNLGLKRAKANSKFKNGDRMERESLTFFEDVRQGFLNLANGLNNKRFIVLDATKSIDDIFKEIVKHISNNLWINSLED